ncbi:MAG: TonB-dependent receptor [Sphingomonas taxi]
MTNKSVLKLLLASAAAVISAQGQAQIAVEAAASGTAHTTEKTKDAAGGGDIIVTAQKRNTKLQDTPLAISVLSAGSLDAQNIVSVVDLNGRIPGLSITQSESFQKLVSIRGVGFSTPQNASVQPGVAFHIDGVYIVGSTALAHDMFDVQQVEVLRGPQGTLYGQNSEGGTINVLTNKPEIGRVEGNADIAYGSYNLLQSRAAVNLPFGDTLALRVTGSHVQRDGFARTTYIGYQLDNANQDGIRAALLWQPSASFSALLSSQYVDIDQHDAALKNIRDPEPDPRRLSQDYPGTFRSKQSVTALTLREDLGFATVTSITSYQYLSYLMNIDNDRLDYAHYTPHDLMPHSFQGTKSVTQEVNITSRPGTPVEWIVGGFYLRQRATNRVIEYYSAYPGQPMPIVFDLSQGFPAGLGYVSVSKPQRDSWSLYGQSTVHISDTVRLTGGLRYTHDRISSLNSAYFSDFTAVGRSDDALTGKLGVEYQATPRNLLYASYTRGFKPGGANLSTSPMLSRTTYRPEKVDAYEVGSKNGFADGRATLNLAAFYYDYRNYQFAEDDPVPYQGGIANADRARIYGVEAEFSAKLPMDFVVDGNVTALSGSIRSTTAALDPVAAMQASNAAAALGYGGFSGYTIGRRAAAARDLDGNMLPFLSPVAFNAGLGKAFDLGGSGRINLRVDYRYQGRFQARIFNAAGLDHVDGYGLLNLSADYAPAASRWKFQVVASNVAGSDAVASTFTNSFGFATTSRIYVQPRQVLARVGYRF